MLLQTNPIGRRNDRGVSHDRRSHSARIAHLPEASRTSVHTIPGKTVVLRTQIRDVSNTYPYAKTQRYGSRRLESGTVDDRRVSEAGNNGGGSGVGKTLSRWNCEKPHLFESDDILDFEWVDLNWDDFK